MKARLALLISGTAPPPGSESGRQGDVTLTRTEATHALLIEEKFNFLFIFSFFLSFTLFVPRRHFHFHSVVLCRRTFFPL